jgi:hypothetical protein
MKIENKGVDFHVHYYPEKIARHAGAHSNQFDPETEKTIEKIISCGIEYVGLLGRISAPAKEATEQIRLRLEAHGINALFGTEYLALLPEQIRHLTSNGLVEVVCLGFDHDSPKIKEKFGPDDAAFNARVARDYIARLARLGFDLSPGTPEHSQILIRLLEGKIPNKSDYLALIISENVDKNREIISRLEREHGPFTDIDRRNNGFTPLKNWLYRLLFKLPSGIVASYHQTPANEIIELVHQANGVVLYSPEGRFNSEIMTYLLLQGIDGAMAWHGGKMDEIPVEWAKKLIRDRKLILGGSDHDPVKDDWQPGIGSGKMYISSRRGTELTQYLDHA